MAPPGRRAVGRLAGPRRVVPPSEETVMSDPAYAGLDDCEAMRREIDSLRAEVKELRRSVEMLLSAVMDGEQPRAQPGSNESEETPPFYN